MIRRPASGVAVVVRWTVRSLMAAVLASTGVLGLHSPVRAECPYFPVPPATDAATTAREVIVGTVVENVGGQQYDFRLRIDHVLRGSAEVGDVRRFEFVYPGWPLQEAGDGSLIAPCEAIPGSEGNVVAFALGALAPDGKTRYNAASWISGLPLHRDGDQVSRTTLAQMRAASELPATDASPAGTRSSASAPNPVVVVVALAAVVSSLLASRWHRLSRRRGPLVG